MAVAQETVRAGPEQWRTRPLSLPGLQGSREPVVGTGGQGSPLGTLGGREPLLDRRRAAEYSPLPPATQADNGHLPSSAG